MSPLLVSDDAARVSVQPSSEFATLLPAIRRTVSYSFRRFSRHQQEELISRAVAKAYEMFVRLVAKGKAALAYPTALAKYAVRQVLAGRCVGTSQNVRDLFSVGGRRQRPMVQVLPAIDALADARKADPAELAALRIDFVDWLKCLCRSKRQLALFLALGNTTNEAAAQFGLSASRVSQIRRELESSWANFQAIPTVA